MLFEKSSLAEWNLIFHPHIHYHSRGRGYEGIKEVGAYAKPLFVQHHDEGDAYAAVARVALMLKPISPF